ncbi:MAG: flagellar hook-length control protein FliK [Magnetococcales bacterium]|nr:flagellar hook-length control protein FliK [Magnetococcales bacterium]
MTLLSAPSPAPVSSVDLLALLGKSTASSSASLVVAPSFEHSLGRAISQRTPPPKVDLARDSSQAAAARGAEDARTADAKADAVRADAAQTRQNRTERIQQAARPEREADPAADPVRSSAEEGEEESAATTAEEDGVEKPERVQRVATLKPKVLDPQGMDGIAQLGVREQVAVRLLHGEPLPAAGAVPTPDMSQTPLSPEELLMQLALLRASAGGGDPSALPAESARPTTALLPSASVAVLAEQMMHSRNAELLIGATENPADAVGKLESTGESATPSGSALRVTGGGRGESVATSTAPLAARSPEFADELMDRVGRMRLSSRGGGGEQLRVTLEPEDLGSLDLRLRVDAQNQVHLLITTETDASRELLQRQMGQLREALARQEMGFGEVIIQVGEQSQERQASAQWGFAREQRRQEEGMGGDAEVAQPVRPVETTRVEGVADGGIHIIV